MGSLQQRFMYPPLDEMFCVTQVEQGPAASQGPGKPGLRALRREDHGLAYTPFCRADTVHRSIMWPRRSRLCRVLVWSFKLARRS